MNDAERGHLVSMLKSIMNQLHNYQLTCGPSEKLAPTITGIEELLQRIGEEQRRLDMEVPSTDEINELKEANRQLQKDLLSERVLRIDIQVQLLGIMRQDALGKLNGLREEAQPETLN